jgi:UDP-N-acetylmuramyl pentapeptide phosphotransferase/UDP-N-acetylglucosamine-1-phosphate transferase
MTYYTWLLIFFVVSLLLTSGLLKLHIPLLKRLKFIDSPKNWSSHTVATPTSGGIALILSFLACSALAGLTGFNFFPLYIFLILIVLSVIGLIDDKINLSIQLRLVFQFVFASIIFFLTGGIQKLPIIDPITIDLGIFSYPVTLLWIMGFMNLYNFADGIDGYASSHSILAAVVLVIIGFGFPTSVGLIILAGSILGFLIFNWQPAKIFMGDTGTMALGFLFAVLPFYFKAASVHYTVFYIAFLFWILLMDGTFTLFKRAFRGEKFWQPHKEHVYERLVAAGLSHAQVVLISLSLSVILSTLLLLNIHFHFMSYWILIGIAMGLFVLYSYLPVYFRRRLKGD